MIYFDINNDKKKEALSVQLYQQHHRTMLQDLELVPNDINYYLLLSKATNITAHLFSTTHYIKAKLNKKNGKVKRSSRLDLSTIEIKRSSPIDSGLAYSIYYKDDDMDMDFALQFLNFQGEDPQGLRRYLEGIKAISESSSTQGLEVPDYSNVAQKNLGGENDNQLDLTTKRLDKALKDIERDRSAFEKLAGLAQGTPWLFCDIFKFFTQRQYCLFLKDRMIILKGVKKDFSSCDEKEIFYYRDITKLGFAPDLVLNKEIDFSAINIGLFQGHKDICRLSTDLRSLFHSHEESENFTLFQGLFSSLLQSSALTQSDITDRALAILKEDFGKKILKKSFVEPYKDFLIQIALAGQFSEMIPEETLLQLLTYINLQYRHALLELDSYISDITMGTPNLRAAARELTHVQLGDQLGGKDMVVLRRAVSYIKQLNAIFQLLQAFGEAANCRIPAMSWSLDMFSPLLNELERNRKLQVKEHALARRTSMDVSSGNRRRASEEQSIAFILQWRKSQLAKELGNFAHREA